ncbi:MAG: gamma-glutamyltransferase [Acidobacteriaceae bacterium]|nr:gamma-glutamyltransferase [Acidobacteriaceae bacterium]
MVASMHPLATDAGVDAMKQGGNAVDAAVATGFALAVVRPQAGNLGGGGFMLLRLANGTTRFIDFRETAPAAATPDMYLDRSGNIIPDASTAGYRAVAVPGSVAGLVHAQSKYGKLSLAKVMAPAIQLARDGFPLSDQDAHDFRDAGLAKFPEPYRIFQRNGDFYHSGDIFRQPELANTLERIARNPSDFYRGSIAKELSAWIRDHGGLITEQDLAGYKTKEREPVRGTYRGYEIISAPPPSSGGVTLIEILNIVEGYDLRKLEAGSAEAIHLTTEAYRRAFFDRAELLGDPDFGRVPVAQLIDKRYAAAWRESLDPDRASQSSGLQRPTGVLEKLDEVAAAEPTHTTHYSVIDAEGSAVAVTTTLNDNFGAHVVAGNLGFLLNDEMDDFTVKRGAPNMFGLLQSEANAISPGKRPLSAMAPTIVLDHGKLFMVLGSRGGPRIISSIANVLMGVVDYGLNIQQAVNAPRFHHQWMPDALRVEEHGFSPDTLKLLKAMGHNVERGIVDNGKREPYWSDVECVAVDQRTGTRLGASDDRGNGKAAGY